MRPRISIITIGVDDLDRALTIKAGDGRAGDQGVKKRKLRTEPMRRLFVRLTWIGVGGRRIS
jgi:hypothetical protein